MNFPSGGQGSADAGEPKVVERQQNPRARIPGGVQSGRRQQWPNIVEMDDVGPQRFESRHERPPAVWAVGERGAESDATHASCVDGRRSGLKDIDGDSRFFERVCEQIDVALFPAADAVTVMREQNAQWMRGIDC